jgi:predicted nucleic acid-binding protein
MIVISDTSPLNYLVLLDADHDLPKLFGQVIVPPAVLNELRHSNAPQKVKAWAAQPPTWLEIQAPNEFSPFEGLGEGESVAIALAQQLQADRLLIDERDGNAVAIRLGLKTADTLAVLELAAGQGLLSLPAAIAVLQTTTFHAPERIYAEMIQRDVARKRGE